MLYTLREAAALLRVREYVLREALREGKLKAVGAGGRRLIPHTEIERLLNGHLEPQAKSA